VVCCPLNVPSHSLTQTSLFVPTLHMLRFFLGYLAPAADPVGKGLGTVLSPVGAVVGTATKPITNTVGSITRPALGPVLGEKSEKMEVLGGDNKDSYRHGKDSLGGRVQDAENPLGLDQTGKFGFREEKK
jgi:hypothetical protein